jgi:dienelactone hydrolase
MKPYRLIIFTATLTVLNSCFVCAAPKQNHATPPQRTMKYTSRAASEAKTWQKNVRARLSRLLKIDDLILMKGSIAFCPEELSFEDKGTYSVRELEINSTLHRRIRIVVSVPSLRGEPLPAVVCLGGHGSNQYSPYDQHTFAREDAKPESDPYRGFGTVLATRGYVTISTTVSQHKVCEEGRLLMGERLWDVIRCVDYIESMPQVDRSRIGCAGLSLGGEMAMWLGAVDERTAATVSSGFLTTMDQMEQNHCMCWKFEGLRDLVDYADIYSLIAPRPLQCQNGLKEPPTQFHVPLARQAMEEIRTIYRDLDRPENAVLDVHEAGHTIDLPGLLYFLEKHLCRNRW